MKTIDEINDYLSETATSFIPILLFINPFIDLFTSIGIRSGHTLTIGTIYRGLLMIYISVSILLKIISNKSQDNKRYLILLSLIFLSSIFLLSRVFIYGYNSKLLLTEINSLMRWLFYFSLYFYLTDFKNNLSSASYQKLIRSFRYAAWVYSLLILVPYLFGFDFKSYSFDDFEGTVGLFYSANEIGGILGLLLLTYLLKIDVDESCQYSIVEPFVISISLIFIGTKLSFLLMLIFWMIFTIVVLGRNNRVKQVIKKKKFYLFLVSLFIGYLIVNSPAFRNFIRIFSYGDRSILDTLLSSRIFYLKEKFLLFSQSRTPLKFFGLGTATLESGTVKIYKTVEMDLFDSLFSFGLPLTILIFYPYLNFFTKLKGVSKHNEYNQIIITIIITITFIWSFLIGHVMSSPSTTIYISVLLWIFNVSQNSDFS